jgi:hypothetical protein
MKDSFGTLNALMGAFMTPHPTLDLSNEFGLGTLVRRWSAL